VPAKTGWIDKKSNDANVQGAVYSYVDTGGSTITPLTGPTQNFTNAGDGKLCVSGKAAKVVGMDYTKYFGAAMGIDLCHGPAMSTTKYTLSTCPGGSKLVGVRFKVTGPAIPPALRATLNETDPLKRKSYVIIASGVNTVKFADAKVLDDAKAPPVSVADIDGLHFTISTNVLNEVPFDFCIENIEPLTMGGQCDMGFAGKPDAGTPPVSTGPGVLPSNLSAGEAKAAYDAWKAAFVVSCGATRSYVKNELGGTYSEGIGYGMLLAAAHGDKATFDALYATYTAASRGGLMDWKLDNGCSGSSNSGPASDGDLDTAMALVQATCKFGPSYTAPATALIGAIKAREVSTQGGLQVLKPGEGFDATCVNPSYFAPGFYRAFSKFTKDTSWDTLAKDSYTILNRLANASTGLVPNWGSVDGSAATGACAAKLDSGLYSYDAARTPWRIATDYRWWSTPEASTYLNKVVGWANTVGIDRIGDKYQTNGTVVNMYPTPVTRGPLANATVATDQATTDAFYQSFKGVTINEYFPATLKALSMTFGAGLFEKCAQ